MKTRTKISRLKYIATDRVSIIMSTLNKNKNGCSTIYENAENKDFLFKLSITTSNITGSKT